MLIDRRSIARGLAVGGQCRRNPREYRAYVARAYSVAGKVADPDCSGPLAGMDSWCTTDVVAGCIELSGARHDGGVMAHTRRVEHAGADMRAGDRGHGVDPVHRGYRFLIAAYGHVVCCGVCRHIRG